MKIAITGAGGFIGRSLSKSLRGKAYEFSKVVRIKKKDDMENTAIGEISSSTDWSKALEGVDCIIHCAGLAHVLNSTGKNKLLSNYDEINALGTLNLAEQAANKGVRRIIFLSSVKVNGEVTQVDKPFFINDKPIPEGPYAISKFKAEKHLEQIASKSNLEVVIIRAPLVYGPGVKANFLRLMNAINKGMPMPLRSIKNKRSLISIDNLISILTVCIGHAEAKNKTFFVSDGYDISTTELTEAIALIMNKPLRLFYIPAHVLKVGGVLSGRSKLVDSLIESLQVDISFTKEILGWTPEFNFEESLTKTVKAFL